MLFVYKQVHLPEDRELRNSLQNVYGVGWRKSVVIAARIGASYPCVFNNLNLYNYFLLSTVLDSFTWLRARINRKISQRILRFMRLKNYRGLRHIDCLPCRGQRTRTNARTRRRWRFELI